MNVTTLRIYIIHTVNCKSCLFLSKEIGWEVRMFFYSSKIANGC